MKVSRLTVKSDPIDLTVKKSELLRAFSSSKHMKNISASRNVEIIDTAAPRSFFHWPGSVSRPVIAVTLDYKEPKELRDALGDVDIIKYISPINFIANVGATFADMQIFRKPWAVFNEQAIKDFFDGFREIDKKYQLTEKILKTYRQTPQEARQYMLTASFLQIDATIWQDQVTVTSESHYAQLCFHLNNAVYNHELQ